MTTQKYLPERKTFITKKSSESERMKELFDAIENGAICYGKVKHCPANAEYLLVDLGFNITGWIPRKGISVDRKYTVAHSLNGEIINFRVENYTPDKGFVLNRTAVQTEANEWQHENFVYGDIIEAKVTKILEKGILVDIGGGVEAFIPPQYISKNFVKDFNTIFEANQIINLKIEGFDNVYQNWILNYADCPQLGLTVNSTYAVSIDKPKDGNSFYCSLLAPKLKGYLVTKGQKGFINIGDIEKATIIAFQKGVPLLKVI